MKASRITNQPLCLNGSKMVTPCCGQQVSLLRRCRSSLNVDVQPSTQLQRRSFLRSTATGIFLATQRSQIVRSEDTEKVKKNAADLELEFVSKGVDPEKLWENDRQIVIVYQQGEVLGESCQQLDSVKENLPVHLIWRLPPDWVNEFPTIQFEVSDRQWQTHQGWESMETFLVHYREFNPPPKSADEVSPYKNFAAHYDGKHWNYPGKIDHHLLNPKAPHRFSQFELFGLTKEEMENLHSAHHQKLLQPGRRPPNQIPESDQ